MKELLNKLPRELIVDGWNPNIPNLTDADNKEKLILFIHPTFNEWAVSYWSMVTKTPILSISRPDILEAIKAMLRFLKKENLLT